MKAPKKTMEPTRWHVCAFALPQFAARLIVGVMFRINDDHTHDLLRRELDSLCGKSVSFRRIAGNTIILYFDGEPGDDLVTTLWIDPSWRYEQGGKALLGSADIPWDNSEFDTEEEYNRVFHSACDRSEPLVGSVLVLAEVSAVGNDLYLEFDIGSVLRSFAGYTVDECWHYRNKGRIYTSSLLQHRRMLVTSGHSQTVEPMR